MRPSILKYFSLATIGWYLFLCTCHYFNQRPLWNDEDAVFYNIRIFSPAQMFHETLMSFQVFPRVYLFLIQQFSKAFDFHLLALRFLPFVAMLSAFFVWVRLADSQIKDRFLYFVYLLSWAASVTLIYYSAELKQYSMDVLLSSLLLFFLLHQEELRRRIRIYRVCLMVAPVFILLSYPAFLFLPIIAWNITRFSSKFFREPEIYLFGISAVVFGLLSYFFDMRLAAGEVYTGYGDYFVHTDSLENFLKTAQEGINNLFSRWFVEFPRIFKRLGRIFVFFGLVQMFTGFFQNIKKDGFKLTSLQTIALVLFAEHFILGVLKKYPFVVPRTSLFFCPIVLWLTVMGIAQLKKIHKFLFGFMITFYIVFLIVVSLGLGRQIFSGDLGAQPIIWRDLTKGNQ